MVQKLHICETVYFYQLLDFQILLLLFLHTLLMCHILLFGCWIFSTPSMCPTVWIQVRPNILSGLIWVQSVCKRYQQTTKVALAGKELNAKQLTCRNYFLAKTLTKVIIFGSYFIHLAKVLATTNSGPG